MRTFVVRWTEMAAEDLASILVYFADDTPRRAVEILDRIESRAASLRTFPMRGRVVPELRWHGITTFRQLVEKPWRIICRVNGAKVLVYAVVDGRRSLEDLLLERFVRS